MKKEILISIIFYATTLVVTYIFKSCDMITPNIRLGLSINILFGVIIYNVTFLMLKDIKFDIRKKIIILIFLIIFIFLINYILWSHWLIASAIQIGTIIMLLITKLFLSVLGLGK